MFLNTKLSKKLGTLALGIAVSTIGLTSSAQAGGGGGFDPVDPESLLSGSVGFYDLSALQQDGRDGVVGKTATSGEFVRDGSQIELEPATLRPYHNNGLFTEEVFVDNDSPSEGTKTPSGVITEIDFKTLYINSAGQINGIATITKDGVSKDVDIAGRAIFRELATREYQGANKSGNDGSGTHAAYPTNLQRNLYHELFISGITHDRFGLQLQAASRAYDVSNGLVTTYDYNPSVTENINSMNGILKTIAGRGQRVGISNVQISGLLDARGVFDTTLSPNTTSVNRTLTSWVSDSEITRLSPSENVISNDSDNGKSTFKYRFHDVVRNYPGLYQVTYVNDNNFNTNTDSSAQAKSFGYFLSTEAEVQQVASGQRSIADLQYRDRSFSFSTPASVTVVRSSYPDPLPLLQRTDIGE